MKTILVPTDFSKNASKALDYAAALASEVKGKLIIVHIINLPITPVENSYLLPPDNELEQDYKKELDKKAKSLLLKNNNQFEVETICQYGYFMANLNDLIKARAVDLVIMGTKGASNFLDKFVGTNTSEFIKSAHCPVLAIPSNAKFRGIKRIAYASDFECEETVYLQQLFAIAESIQAEVFIVNIVTEQQLNIVPDYQITRDISKHFPDDNYSIAQIQKEDVVEGLHDFVQGNKADVLAVSIHNRGILESIFHKSVTKQLIFHPTLPLLALPEKPYAKPLKKTKSPKKQIPQNE